MTTTNLPAISDETMDAAFDAAFPGLPSGVDAQDARRRLHRALITVQHQIVAEAVKEHLCLPLLAALRCIPDGEIRSGCHVHDGRQVRERVRAAYLALTKPAEPGQTCGTDHAAEVTT